MSNDTVSAPMLDASTRAYMAETGALRTTRILSTCALTAFLAIWVSPLYILTFGVPQTLVTACLFYVCDRGLKSGSAVSPAKALPFVTGLQVVAAMQVCWTGIDLHFNHRMPVEGLLLVLSSLVLSALRAQPTRLTYFLGLAPPLLAMALITFVRPLDDARTGVAIALLIASMTATAMRQQKHNRGADRLRAESEATAAELARTLDLADLAEEVASIGHWRLNVARTTHTWSPGVFKIFGFPVADTPPPVEAMLACYLPGGREEVARLIDEAFASRCGLSFEQRILRTDGALRILLVKSRFAADENGALLTGVVQDVTEARMAEQERIDGEARYRLLADNVGDIIVQSDAEGFIRYISPACLAITGYAPEELLGRRAVEFIEPADVDAVRDAMGRAVASRSDEAWMIEYRFRHKDGSVRWLEAHPRLVRDPKTGRRTGLIDVVRDAEARKALEAELVAARAEAEAGGRAKADFLANMSHELRTPLSSIVGFSTLVAEAAELEPETRRRARLTRDASQALVAIVNDVLDLSKLEAEGVTLSPEPVDLADLLTGAAELVREEADRKGLTLTLQMPPQEMRVLADPMRLRQVVLNLLSNAVKFTQKGGVTLSLGRDGSDRVRIAVRDTGIGIAADRLQAVFGRFAQADGSTVRRFGGTGLGLTISRTLVEAMDGTLDVHSTEGAGSTFTVVIDPPAAQPPLQSLQDTDAAPAPRLRARILLADDNPMNRDLFTALLSGEDFDITCVEDGAQAVRAVQEQRFDLVFMDVQMPVMDGLDAVRAIRSLGLDLPVVALTANVMPESIAKARQAGMSDHLSKPYGARDLLEAIARWVDQEEPSASTIVSSDVLTRLGRALGPDRLSHFLAGLAEQLDESLAAFAQPTADPQGLSQRAHSVRGYAGSLGYIDIARAYGALEAAIAEGTPLAPFLADAVRTTRSALADLRARKPAAA